MTSDCICTCIAVQGMQSIGIQLQDSKALVRLWAHEALRVFHDRLVDEIDRDWFCGLLSKMLPKHLGMTFEAVFDCAGLGATAVATNDATDPNSSRQQQASAAAALRSVLYADFLQPGGAEAAKYQEAADITRLLKAVEAALVDYNEQAKVDPSKQLFAVSWVLIT